MAHGQKTGRQVELEDIFGTTGDIASYLRNADTSALAMTSKSMRKAVKKQGPRQPYVKRCIEQNSNYQLPLEFFEGCGNLYENIMRLFSSVVVMASEVNLNGIGVMNMVKFDIQDLFRLSVAAQADYLTLVVTVCLTHHPHHSSANM